MLVEQLENRTLLAAHHPMPFPSLLGTQEGNFSMMIVSSPIKQDVYDDESSFLALDVTRQVGGVFRGTFSEDTDNSGKIGGGSAHGAFVGTVTRMGSVRFDIVQRANRLQTAFSIAATGRYEGNTPDAGSYQIFLDMKIRTVDTISSGTTLVLSGYGALMAGPA